MQINITYDPSAANAPAGFETAVQAAVEFFETTFTDSVTVNINFGWGTVDGQPMDATDLGESLANYQTLSYVGVKAALDKNAGTVWSQLAARWLPAADPTNGGVFEVSTADAKALGLTSATGSALDGWVGLSTSAGFTFDPSNRAVSGLYDAIGILEHEISEVLGRVSFLGGGGGTPEFGLLDLFRYAAPGQLNPTSPTGQFSVDGSTLLMPFNDPSSGGDSGDWGGNGPFDSFDAIAPPGRLLAFSQTDLAVMNVLGYHQAQQPPIAQLPNVTPSGVMDVSTTTTIAAGQDLYFGNNSGIVILGSGVGGPSVTNSAIVVAVSSDARVIEVGGGSFFQGSEFTNTASGAIYSEALTGDADGYFSGSWAPNLVNEGLIQTVSMMGNAYGVETWDLYFKFTNARGATLKVWALAEAVGVDMSGGNNGGSFTNAGDIEVTGASAVAVRGATYFANSGTISAISLDHSQPSIAVDVSDENAQTYTNYGVISADEAFFVEQSVFNPNDNIHLINDGTMVGAISLGAGTNQINNSGTITGDIHASTLTLANAGTIHGDIDISGGQSTLTNTGAIVGDIILHDDAGSAADVVDLRAGSFTGDVAVRPGLLGDVPVQATIWAGSGAALVTVAKGETQLSLTVNGAGQGITTVQFDVALAQAIETHNADGSWTINAGADGVATLNNVQQAMFSDITLVFDLHSSEDLLVYELYQAAYDRTPDNSGFRFWAGVADANHSSGLALADAFLAAPEFALRYGASPSNLQYVTELYANVLGRTPDQSGLNYWVGQANAGQPRDQLLVDFATSTENVSLIGTHISNGYWTTH